MITRERLEELIQEFPQEDMPISYSVEEQEDSYYVYLSNGEMDSFVEIEKDLEEEFALFNLRESISILRESVF